MKSFKNIRKDLQDSARVEPTARDDFWKRFNARATHIAQDSAPQLSFYQQHAFGIRWATAAASMALLGGVVFMHFHPAAAYASDTVHAIDVSVPHTSISIMNGSKGKSTIIWIEGI
ncbi:MAG: hypothetical protein O3C57_00520 [Verrucomicrobia bacterium]|nr:hypothetical protein [Verrucomicrobiota bacterium]